MAGLKDTDTSPLADALVLTALFAPFAPVVATLYLAGGAEVLACPADTGTPCLLAGLDLNALYADSAALLERTARAFAGGALLLYIALLGGLAQFTTQGFRGRIVRTCAVIMWAGVMPLLLGLADAAARGALAGTGPFTGFARYGQVLFDWVADIAVPLAVMVTALVALTLGYRMLIGRFVRLILPRE